MWTSIRYNRDVGFDPSERAARRRLRVILGAAITLVVILGLILVATRRLEYWSPPGVVGIPRAPRVTVALESHPRLVVTADAIDALAGNPESPEYSRIMAMADRFYDEYLVDPLQGDTIYPGYFALAWRISGEERYLDAARDMVLRQCRFPRWRSQPESANFYKIELGYPVGLAYDLLYDEFTDRERIGIERRLSEVLDGLLWHLQGNPSKPFWYGAPHSNYYVAQHSAAGLLALCLGDAYPGWEEALAFAYDGLRPSIELLEKDGGWIEGLTYLDFCWGQHAFLFLNSLRVNRGPNRLEEDWYRTSVLFALAGILPSGTQQVDFGDNIADPIASFGYLWRARSLFDSDFLDDFLERNIPEPDWPRIPLDALLVQAMLEFDPSLPLGALPEPEPCLYFPGIEWAMLREDWTNPDGFYLATKAGYGGWDHNHVDQGTFVLAFDGVTFVRDPGRGDFNERRDECINMIFGGPMGHSVFVPAGPSGELHWEDFTMYSSNERYRQADAAIVDWESTDECASFRMVLDGAYPSEDVTRWRRHFVWREPIAELPGGAVLILDEIDVEGRFQLATSMSVGERIRDEGFTIRDESLTDRPLGVYSYSVPRNSHREFLELLTNSERLNSVAVFTDQFEGVFLQLTVLLPYDDIAGVVCEGYSDEDTIGAFVDGFAFEFQKDENGDWRFVRD